MPSTPSPKPARGRDAMRPGDLAVMLCCQQALVGQFTVAMMRRGSVRGLTMKRDRSPCQWPPFLN
jgi:hypothetical protein